MKKQLLGHTAMYLWYFCGSSIGGIFSHFSCINRTYVDLNPLEKVIFVCDSQSLGKKEVILTSYYNNDL